MPSKKKASRSKSPSGSKGRAKPAVKKTGSGSRAKRMVTMFQREECFEAKVNGQDLTIQRINTARGRLLQFKCLRHWFKGGVLLAEIEGSSSSKYLLVDCNAYVFRPFRGDEITSLDVANRDNVPSSVALSKEFAYFVGDPLYPKAMKKKMYEGAEDGWFKVLRGTAVTCDSEFDQVKFEV